MNAQMPLKTTAVLQNDITPEGSDYEIVRRAIEKISLDYRDQPSLEILAEEVGETPTGLQKLFTRWAGLSPKALLQAVTLEPPPATKAQPAPSSALQSAAKAPAKGRASEGSMSEG